MKPRLDIHGERERPGDCSVWTLPVGIRKSDGPVWSSSVGRDGQYVQCKRESFEGGSQRGYGDGVKEKRSWSSFEVSTLRIWSEWECRGEWEHGSGQSV